MNHAAAIVLTVGRLDRRRRRAWRGMAALAQACARWLHYGWRAASSVKFLRLAACSIAFAATVAGANASGPVAPAGSAFPISQNAPWLDKNAAVAVDADGDFVVVWESGPFGQGRLLARRYNAAGVAQGDQFLVHQTTQNPDIPDVAMDAAGNFTVVWAQGGGGGRDIYARRFDAAGNALGQCFLVNQKTALEQAGPAIAMEPDGDFVVTWDSAVAENPGSSYSFFDRVGIAARRFDADGEPLGGEFCVNSSHIDNQTEPDVAVDGDGDFVVVWMSRYHDGDQWGVVGQRFDSGGEAVGDEFLINEWFTGHQQHPRVAMDAEGNFAVTWQSYYYDVSQGASSSPSVPRYSLLLRGYNADGSPRGGEQIVERGDIVDNDFNYVPSIAMDADGDFAVAWERQTPAGNSIWMRAYKPDGQPEGGAMIVSSLGSLHYAPDIAASRGGNFVVVRDGIGPGDPDGVFGRRYKAASDIAPPVVAGVHLPADNSHVLQDERLCVNPDRLVVVLSQDMDGVDDPSLWTLSLDGALLAGAVVDVAFGFNAATNRHEAVVSLAEALVDGEYELTLSAQALGANGLTLDGDFDGQQGGDFTRRFVVARQVPIGGDMLSSEPFVSGVSRGAGAVAMDAQGNYVVVWNEFRDLGPFTNSDVYLRRYDAQGQALGAVINVTDTNGNAASLWESQPCVAMDADGDFVVVWIQASPYAPLAAATTMQRFDKTGAPLAPSQPVNFGFVSMPHETPAIAMDDEGDFVVTIAAPYYFGTAERDVFATRYDRDGNFQQWFLVNFETSGNQASPCVAMDTAGNFVIAWVNGTSSGADIQYNAYRFNGEDMQVYGNVTTTPGDELQPAVAMDSDGDFVVTWLGLAYSTYGSPLAYEVMARLVSSRFEAGDVFRVSFTPTGASNPAVAMDHDGDFVITFDATGASSTLDVFGARFSATGEALDAAQALNVTLSGMQAAPAVDMDADGDFVVCWTGDVDFVSSSTTYNEPAGIAHRRFGANEAPVTNWAGTLEVDEDAPDQFIDVAALAVFSDSTDAGNLAYSVAGNDNPGLVTPTFSGGVLQLALSPDQTGVAVITVRATDSGGKWADGTLTLTVNPVNDAPVLAAASPQLTDVLEDATNPPGNTVAEIVGSSISDVDAGAQQGIAIIAAPANVGSEGRWQYFTGEGGTWTNFPVLSAASALLLRPADKVRFVPVAGFVGSRSLTYHAWDQTAGAFGPGGDLSGGVGGTTAFSATTNTATVAVNSINDAPVLDNLGSPTLSDVNEDDAAPPGNTTLQVFGSAITDPDPGALKGIAVIGVDTVNGTWQYSVDAGVNWVDLSSASNSAAVLLRDIDMVRFLPNAEFNGAADISYRAWDRTSGNPGDSVSLSGGGTTGGSTAFSAETESATVTVLPVNDAPILDSTGTPRLGTISNNHIPAGSPVTTLIGASITDPDIDALEGVAITDVTGAGGGFWQYSIDAGATFVNFPAVSEAMALLLRDTDLVRFAPNTNFVGAATVTFRAWDQSSGTAGTMVDLTPVGAVGGITPYSNALETASVDVTAAGEDDKGNNCAATGGSTAGLGLLTLLLAVLGALRAACSGRPSRGNAPCRPSRSRRPNDCVVRGHAE